VGAVWPLCVERADGFVDRGVSCAELLDALGCERDDYDHSF
jgi:hypothetical protein